MSKTIAYIRVSKDKQEINNQKLEILEWCHRRDMKIDEFVEIVISSKKSDELRRIDYLIKTLGDDDILLMSELSRIGRSVTGVINTINALLQKNVRIIAIKENLDIKKHDMQSKIIVTMFGLFAEIEHDLISARIKNGLAYKREMGIPLGKPKGTIQKSKFDEHVDKIKELLSYGLSERKIAKYLGCNSHIGLSDYIKRKGIKEQLK